MTQQHPITMPPELVKELWDKIRETPINSVAEEIAWNRAISQAVHWATDQANADIERKLQKAADKELDACCELIYNEGFDVDFVANLRAARRPKPPSLKEQALKVLSETELRHEWTIADEDIIRRALEQLPTGDS